jgi:hypothetical protein
VKAFLSNMPGIWDDIEVSWCAMTGTNDWDDFIGIADIYTQNRNIDLQIVLL